MPHDAFLENLSFIASIIAAVVAVIGLPLLLWQLFVARSQRQDAIRLSTAQTLLSADSVFASYAEISSKLRPGGQWFEAAGTVHPADDEFAQVEPYMGVFERLFIAWQAKQVDARTLNDLYGYRVANIWANKRIVDKKLQNDRLKKSWRGLIALTFVLEAHRGARFPLHTDSYFPAELFDRRFARKLLAAVGGK